MVCPNTVVRIKVFGLNSIWTASWTHHLIFVCCCKRSMMSAFGIRWPIVSSTVMSAWGVYFFNKMKIALLVVLARFPIQAAALICAIRLLVRSVEKNSVAPNGL